MEYVQLAFINFHDTRHSARNAMSFGMVSSDVLDMMSELDMLIHLIPNQCDGLEEMRRASNSKMLKLYILFEFGEWMIGLGINYLSTTISGGMNGMFRCVMRPGNVLLPPAFGLRHEMPRRHLFSMAQAFWTHNGIWFQ